jgi:flagellar basal-body rod protein FlgF
MFRGFYHAASGMLTQQRRVEMLTNNLANIHTPGYKADQSSVRAFPEMLLQRLETEKSPTGNVTTKMSRIGSTNTGVYVQDLTPKFKQGDLNKTELSTDLALNNITMPTNADGMVGSIFFTVENPDGGLQYTRNGNFTLDGFGFLTNANGQYILDTAGNPIQLTSDQFTVTTDGWIQQNGQNVARLGIGYAENPNELTKTGEGLFAWNDGQALPSAYENDQVSFSIQQGYLERSNVDATESMTEMLAAYRTFEANQKVLQAYDRSMDKAVNEIGKI